MLDKPKFRWFIYSSKEHSGWWRVEYPSWGWGDGFIGHRHTFSEAVELMLAEIRKR